MVSSEPCSPTANMAEAKRRRSQLRNAASGQDVAPAMELPLDGHRRHRHSWMALPRQTRRTWGTQPNERHLASDVGGVSPVSKYPSEPRERPGSTSPKWGVLRDDVNPYCPSYRGSLRTAEAKSSRRFASSCRLLGPPPCPAGSQNRSARSRSASPSLAPLWSGGPSRPLTHLKPGRWGPKPGSNLRQPPGSLPAACRKLPWISGSLPEISVPRGGAA